VTGRGSDTEVNRRPSRNDTIGKLWRIFFSAIARNAEAAFEFAVTKLVIRSGWVLPADVFAARSQQAFGQALTMLDHGVPKTDP
jgi:hypothetical protein